MLLEFERRGKDALASLVLVNGAMTIFADFPAVFEKEGQDLWRADDGGRISLASFDVVCLLWSGSSYTLGLAWYGGESLSESLWTSNGSDRFTRVLQESWYQPPR